MKPASVITIVLGLCIVIGAAVLTNGGGSAEVLADDDDGPGERLQTADDPRSVSPGA